jgi:hypothetical protein
MNETNGNQSSLKEKHDLLYGIHKQLFLTLLDFEFKQWTLLIVIIGWILTAERAQELFRSSVVIRIGISSVVLSLTLLHATWAIRFYLRSAAVRRQLFELNYMPSGHYKPESIARFLVMSLCTFHFIVCGFILVVIWLLPSIIRSLPITP